MKDGKVILHRLGTLPKEERWEAAYRAYGRQPARYLTARFSVRVRVHCEACRKPIGEFGRRVRKPLRRRAVLTRSTLVCHLCYDPQQHGEPIWHTVTITLAP